MKLSNESKSWLRLQGILTTTSNQTQILKTSLAKSIMTRALAAKPSLNCMKKKIASVMRPLQRLLDSRKNTKGVRRRWQRQPVSGKLKQGNVRKS